MVVVVLFRLSCDRRAINQSRSQCPGKLSRKSESSDSPSRGLTVGLNWRRCSTAHRISYQKLPPFVVPNENSLGGNWRLNTLQSESGGGRERLRWLLSDRNGVNSGRPLSNSQAILSNDTVLSSELVAFSSRFVTISVVFLRVNSGGVTFPSPFRSEGCLERELWGLFC